MIEVNNLSYTFRKEQVLERVSFKVNNGKLYGIFGDKSSGKSTLLALLAGGIPLQTGTVRINGFDLAKNASSAKKCLGYLPSGIAFYPDMTPYELLNFVASARNVREDRKFLHVHETLENMGLGDLRDHPLSRLSPFQKRKLGLAQTLIGNPEILILDDPASGLTASEGKELRAIIKELAEHGKTVFLATSEATGLPALCDEIFLLRNRTLEPPTPVAELISGASLRISVNGKRELLPDALSGIPEILSCRVLPSETAGELNLLLRVVREGMADSVTDALQSNGFEILRANEEALGEAERALRRASFGLSGANFNGNSNRSSNGSRSAETSIAPQSTEKEKDE